MGQFKPMVKMETTEPSIELKLKKGGSVMSTTKMKTAGGQMTGKKMMGGGPLSMLANTPALVGRPAVNAPVRAPGKPSMSARRKAMMAKPAMKDGGESKSVHKAETTKMKGLEKDIKSHESKPASKAHKGLKKGGMACATGGVALGNAGGYKDGGMAKGGKMPMKDGKPAFLAKGMMGGGGMHMMPNGKMMKNSAMKKGGKACATGGVMDGNAGGYATGGVAMGNAGGYKMGGKALKKAYATGGSVESGAPVAMPQGRRKPAPAVSNNRVAGTYKKGGTVTPMQGKLQKMFGMENASAMKSAKAPSNEPYGKMKNLGSLTKTTESVTVTPTKKRGGSVC